MTQEISRYQKTVSKNGAMKAVGFCMVTMFLVLVGVLCAAGTVFSRGKLMERELTDYYQDKEKEMVREVREYLEEEGFLNSGVTLTKVLEENGKREYTLTVHHRKIDRMDEQSREMLKTELAEFDFSAENCIFSHEFLMED